MSRNARNTSLSTKSWIVTSKRNLSFRNLLTRRKLQLQSSAAVNNCSFETAGNSIERSMESYESTESNPLECIGTSFESNVSNVSNVSHCSSVSNNGT